MPIKLSENDYRVAYEIFKNDCSADPEDEILPAKEISAEKALIKIQAWERLSNEAKELIDIILNSPNEIVDLIATPRRHEVTVRSIHKHLAKVFKSNWVAQQIIREIQEWVKHL